MRAERQPGDPPVRVLVPQPLHDQLPARGEGGDQAGGAGQGLAVGGPAQHHGVQAHHQPDQAGPRRELHLRPPEHGPGHHQALHIKR